jgi:hypothetical protein
MTNLNIEITVLKGLSIIFITGLLYVARVAIINSGDHEFRWIKAGIKFFSFEHLDYLIEQWQKRQKNP